MRFLDLLFLMLLTVYGIAIYWLCRYGPEHWEEMKRRWWK